jgi:VIT1/CCC1 family predicted Fe2+/Mn2+ transporter
MMDERTRKILDGQGYVPYRGQPEPGNKRKSPHRRPYSKTEKQVIGCTISVLALALPIEIAFVTYYLIKHDANGAFTSIIVLIFTVFLAGFYIGPMMIARKSPSKGTKSEIE